MVLWAAIWSGAALANAERMKIEITAAVSAVALAVKAAEAAEAETTKIAAPDLEAALVDTAVMAAEVGMMIAAEASAASAAAEAEVLSTAAAHSAEEAVPTAAVALAAAVAAEETERLRSKQMNIIS